MLRGPVLLYALACAQPSEPAVRFIDSASDSGGVLGLIQLDCTGWLGESMLIVGPDGTRVLLDVGNDEHAPAIRDSVIAYTGAEDVDAVVLTHFHEDHAGGLGAQTLPWTTLVSRGAVHLDGAEAPDGFDRFDRVDLCTEGACTLPWTLPLGEGAELIVFAADGEISDERFADIPGDDDGENARSLVGVVRWGSFVYLWNGDLTGGGKDTPDIEGFYASKLDPWLPATGATVAHLGHHGIDSSTNTDWVTRVFPDGSPHFALVGSNGSYLDAPADEVLDRVRDHVEGVWVTRGGALTGDDPILHDIGGDVVIEVSSGGERARILAGGVDTTVL